MAFTGVDSQPQGQGQGSSPKSVAQASVYSLMKPGDIVIDEVVLKSCNGFEYSLLVPMQEIVIHEDIYNNSLSGSITFVDSLNLSKHMPIVGNEELSIVFYTPGQPNQALNKISLKLKVYKVSQRQSTEKEKQVFISLEFVSKEFFNSTLVKFSRSYKNMTYGLMMREIFKTYFVDQGSPTLEHDQNNIYWYDTYGKRSFIVPYWSPLYTINWLTNHSYTIGRSGEKMSDYMFYQTVDGKYNFFPLSHLKTLGTVANYRYVPADQSTGTKLMDNATNFIIVDAGNKMRDIGSGVFASTLTTIDITNKEIEHSKFSYKNSFSDLAHVGKYPIVPAMQDKFSDWSLSYRKIQPKHAYKYDKVKDADGYKDYALSRQSLLNQMNSLTIRIDVPGDSRRKVGDIVEFDMTSAESVSKKADKSDPYISGKYMITKIAHYLKTDGYVMVMTLNKDSYDNPIADVKENTLGEA